MELSKVTMILRGYTYEQVRCVAEVLINSSYVKNMEITLNTSNAYEIIKKIADEFQGRLHIGAGTVQTYDELVQAIAAGAVFVLSPRKMTCSGFIMSIPKTFSRGSRSNNSIRVFIKNPLLSPLFYHYLR